MCMFFTYIGIIKILIYWQLVLWLRIQTGSQIHICLVPNSFTDLMCIMRLDTYSFISIQKNPKNSTCSCLLGATKKNSLIPVRKHYYWYATVMRYKYMSYSVHINKIKTKHNEQTKKTHHKTEQKPPMIKQDFFCVETEITWKVLWQWSSPFFLGQYCCLRLDCSDFFGWWRRWKILLLISPRKERWAWYLYVTLLPVKPCIRATASDLWVLDCIFPKEIFWLSSWP